MKAGIEVRVLGGGNEGARMQRCRQRIGQIYSSSSSSITTFSRWKGRGGVGYRAEESTRES